MKKFVKIWLSAATMLMLLGPGSHAQNPNWTMPPGMLHGAIDFAPLPATPYHPDFGVVTDPNLAYQGEPARAMHNSYSDNNGNLLFFTVDEKVYDKDGFVVGKMFEGYGQLEYKRGFNQRLILPMGNSCTEFAILTSSSANNWGDYETYNASDRIRLYMTTYDISTNDEFTLGRGSLFTTTNGATIKDISKRDGMLYSTQTFTPYGFHNQQGVQGKFQVLSMASSDLIDDCFYYVFVYDGRNLMRYKLTENDLEWDDYVFTIPSIFHGFLRSQMEMVELPSGNYRLAVPRNALGGQGQGFFGDAITVLDLDANFEVISQ